MMGTMLDSKKTPLAMVTWDNNYLTTTAGMENCLYAKDIAS